MPIDDDVAVRLAHRGAELGQLLVSVAHRRQYGADARVAGIGLGDRADGIRARVDDLGGAVVVGGYGAGTERHATVGDGGAVLDDEDPFARKRSGPPRA